MLHKQLSKRNFNIMDSGSFLALPSIHETPSSIEKFMSVSSEEHSNKEFYETYATSATNNDINCFFNICNQLQQCNLLDKSLFNELNNIQYLGQINDSKEIMKALQQYIEQHPNSKSLFKVIQLLQPLASNIASASQFNRDFDVLELLGKGGFGSVYKVRHKLDHHLYAVKRIKILSSYNQNELFEKTKREIETMAQMNDIHIVRYHYAWFEQNWFPYVKESKLMYIHHLSILRGRSSEDQAYISESVNDYDSESENIFNSSEESNDSFSDPRLIHQNYLQYDSQVFQSINFQYYPMNLNATTVQISSISSSSQLSNNSLQDNTNNSIYIQKNPALLTPTLSQGIEVNTNSTTSTKEKMYPSLNKDYISTTYSESKLKPNVSKEQVQQRIEEQLLEEKHITINNNITKGTPLFTQSKRNLVKTQSQEVVSSSSSYKSDSSETSTSESYLTSSSSSSSSSSTTSSTTTSTSKELLADLKTPPVRHPMSSSSGISLSSETSTNSELLDQLHSPLQEAPLAELQDDFPSYLSMRSIFKAEGEEPSNELKRSEFITQSILSSHPFTSSPPSSSDLFLDMKDLLKPQEESSISHDTSLMNNQNILDQNHLALVIHNKKANRYHNANRYVYKKKNGMKFGITLYIQMELCSSKTLKDYLNKRNASSTVINLTEIQHYYKQLLQGLHYIHSKNFIHRDIKPENLFLEGDLLKIGDFGLVTLQQCKKKDDFYDFDSPASIQSTTNSSYTSGVGTRLYASPEQLISNDYTTAVDIYSAGLILVELLLIFKTSRERVETFTSLRKDPTTLPLSLKETYPQYYTLLQKMLSHNYNERPTAKELLDSHLFDTPQEETMQSLLEQNQRLQQELAQAKLEIEELKRQLHQSVF